MTKAQMRIQKTWLAKLVPVVIVASAMTATPALAAPLPAQVVPGAVVRVAGTPNLWIADDQGLLHFASDPRALAGRNVDWNAQLGLELDQAAALPVGDPWLTTALVKIGDSIFLPQYDANAGVPTLRHIQSPADLAALGINAGNYQQYVLDQQTWEQRFNLSLAGVTFDGDFALAPPALAAPDASNDTTTHNDNSGIPDPAGDIVANAEF